MGAIDMARALDGRDFVQQSGEGFRARLHHVRLQLAYQFSSGKVFATVDGRSKPCFIVRAPRFGGSRTWQLQDGGVPFTADSSQIHDIDGTAGMTGHNDR